MPTTKYSDPTYYSWAMMRNRCYSPTNKDFPRYGGIGATTCSRWSRYANFLEDMGPKPFKGMSIQRIDESKPFGPDNCVWATAQDRANKKATMLKYRGRKKSKSEWARYAGISRGCLAYRLSKGMPLEQALKKKS